MVIAAPTNHKNGVSFWWLIIIETFAAISAIIANILTIRVNKNFFYFNTIALMLWMINSFMLGLYVDNIKMILLYLPIIIRFSRWRTGEHHKVTPRRIHPLYVLPLLVSLTLVSLVFGFFVFANFDAFPMLDSFSLIFGVAQAILVAYGIIEGLAVVWLVTVCLLWVNFASGNYIGFIVASIFFVNMNANIMAWLSLYHREHGTFKYRSSNEISPLLNDVLNKYI